MPQAVEHRDGWEHDWLSMPWPRSRKQPAQRETAKYYVYVSDAKLDLLYGQMPEPFWRRLAAELKVDFKLLSITLRGAEQAPERARYAKLRVVTEYVRREFEIGTVDEPAAYFEGQLPLCWGPLEWDPDVICFAGATARTRLLLSGSRHHLLGESGGSMTHAGSATGSLITILRHIELDQPPEATNRRLEESRNGALFLVGLANHFMDGPTQQFEFLAKRSLQGSAPPRFPEQVVLGTPIYVAQVD